MFFFFDEQLYSIYEIRRAFELVCLNKMLTDGYFDMSVYIFGRIRKVDMYSRLITQNSKYAILYEGSYPRQENAYEEWYLKISENSDFEELTQLDAEAIVYWVYRCFKNSEQRINFTKELFAQVKELHNIKHNIKYSQGVFYNKAKVELHFFTTVFGLNRFISSLKNDKNRLFFRGHANANYILQPSVFRNNRIKENESKMYHDLLINCPSDFEKCNTHLEKLVEMQHYGLPTRLLDITRNILVALYFACESNPESFGEIVLISANEDDIKYPQSDTVSVVASLPVFSYKKQLEFLEWANNPSINKEKFNSLIGRLIHEVRLEKPAFQADVNKEDILQSFIVYALKNNNRIIKQDGAFILCGLDNPNNSLEKFRYRIKNKKIVVLVSKKQQLLEQLERMSINKASLFPEIDFVAEYIKNKYK